MGKSYTELKKEFEQEWAKNLKLYIEAGMSPEFIAAMREFDEEVFRKERTFQDKTPSRIEYWDDPRLDNPVEYFSQPKKDLDTQLENILSYYFYWNLGEQHPYYDGIPYRLAHSTDDQAGEDPDGNGDG